MNQRLAKEFLERENKRYSKILNLKPPVLIYTQKELSKIKYKDKQLEKRFKGKEFDYAGITYDNYEGHPNKIFINIKDHEKASDLIDTLVHELIHIKNDVDHGQKFQDLIDNVILQS